jgi:DNA-binding NarL/FixJ family response regulator
MKHEATEKVLDAIRKVLAGEVYLGPKIANTLLSRFVSTRVDPGKSPLDALSDRELEIFNLIGQGLATRQIAEKLSLGTKTVDTHREHIKQKLGFADGQRAAAFRDPTYARRRVSAVTARGSRRRPVGSRR